MRYLVTGTAGFIGFHLARRLLHEGHQVVGIDGFTPYYDLALKERRNEALAAHDGFRLHRVRLEDADALLAVWNDSPPDLVVHLAAQAGVRYSLESPRAFIDSNVVGTFNLLELARTRPPGHLMLASTSSVYGANAKQPFQETDRTDHPLSLYAATKKATEEIAHAYSSLFAIPTTAFRFFTVYGPWGRPDMALFKFTKGIVEGEPIDVYNSGRMERDFTYIDDLVEAIFRLSLTPPVRGRPVRSGDVVDSLSPAAAFRTVNIGGGQPVGLLDFLASIEAAIGRKAIRRLMPMMPGDVAETVADPGLLEALTGFRPATSIDTGVARFVAWYRDYYQV